jgi:hypothetical protein
VRSRHRRLLAGASRFSSCHPPICDERSRGPSRLRQPRACPEDITDGDGTSLTAVTFLRSQNQKRMGAVDSLRRA